MPGAHDPRESGRWGLNKETDLLSPFLMSLLTGAAAVTMLRRISEVLRHKEIPSSDVISCYHAAMASGFLSPGRDIEHCIHCFTWLLSHTASGPDQPRAT